MNTGEEKKTTIRSKERIVEFGDFVIAQKKLGDFQEGAVFSLVDCLMNDTITNEDLAYYLKAIKRPLENREMLREMFRDGMTPILIPSFMSYFENKKICFFQLINDETGEVILSIGDEDIRF